MAAARLVALFNLRPGVDAAAYERWAHERDVPTVNALASVAGFDVRRVTGVLGGGSAPYAYLEVIDVADTDRFGEEIATPQMQVIAAEFQAMVDVVFLTTEPL